MTQQTPLRQAQQLLSNSTVIGNKIAHKNVEQIQAFALLAIAESMDGIEKLLQEINQKLDGPRGY